MARFGLGDEIQILAVDDVHQRVPVGHHPNHVTGLERPVSRPETPTLGVHHIQDVHVRFDGVGHVADALADERGLLRNDLTENAYVWGALALSALILVGTVYLPVVSLALGTAPIGLEGWLVVLGMSLVPLGLGQLEREYRRHFGTPALGWS